MRDQRCQTGEVPVDEGWVILDAAPDATIVVDRSGTITYANCRTAEVLGWDAADLVGRSVDELVPGALRDRHRGHRESFGASPLPRMMGAGLELVAVRKDGSEIPVEIALSPLAAHAHALVVASIRDISERVEMTRQLNVTTSRLAVVDERDRIARDLHDNVIQRLFAAGLHLQASLGRPDQDERVATVIDEIDEAIKEIRTTIFTMHSPRGLHAGFEPALRLVLAEASRVLGHQPRLVVNGMLAVVPDDLARETVDVIRELLTNVAKHAKADTSTVMIDVSDDGLVVSVDDDGVGIDLDPMRPGQGLRNLTDRAQRRGGAASFVPIPTGGTCATWRVPFD